jgi:oligopeptide/dipeptide ABC transporter ATP-binding protein
MKENIIVKIEDLVVHFKTIDGVLKVLQGVNIVVHESEVVGIVGETGCGKTVTAKLLIGILPMPPAIVENGKVFFLGKDLLKTNRTDREALKQNIGYIPQDPTASLNPVFSIGTLMVDMIIWRRSGQHLGDYLWKRREKSQTKKAETYATELLDKVYIAAPKSILKKYPVELSGGMRQRVLLAMALIGSPSLLVADEPTTALDVTIQKSLLHLLQEKVKEERLSGLYITHNLGVARAICHRTYVMYAGSVVENGVTSEMLDQPLHPYTKGLVNSIPKLTGEQFQGIDGQVPDYLNPPPGCRFHPRCDRRMEICSRKFPEMTHVKENRSVVCWLYH